MAKTTQKATTTRKKTATTTKAAKPSTRTTAKAPARPRAKAKAAPAALAAEDATGPLKTALEVAKLALDKKALDVVVLDVGGLASYADYFVVMTAESDPQLNAIADHVETKMKERGERPYAIEGARSGQWVLLDFGDVVAHVFYKDAREFYDIEGLWADARRIPVAG